MPTSSYCSAVAGGDVVGTLMPFAHLLGVVFHWTLQKGHFVGQMGFELVVYHSLHGSLHFEVVVVFSQHCPRINYQVVVYQNLQPGQK